MPEPCDMEERKRLPDAILFDALVYVPALWKSRISKTIWQRARYILAHRDRIVAQIAAIPPDSEWGRLTGRLPEF